MTIMIVLCAPLGWIGLIILVAVTVEIINAWRGKWNVLFTRRWLLDGNIVKAVRRVP
jgi:hypothetical protein